MKRFVSLILSVCFLFSINTVSYAANISSRKASNPVIQSMNDKYHVDFSGMSIDELNKFIDKMKDEDQTRASGNLLNNTQLAWLAAAQIARDKGYECAALMVEFSVYNIDYIRSQTSKYLKGDWDLTGGFSGGPLVEYISGAGYVAIGIHKDGSTIDGSSYPTSYTGALRITQSLYTLFLSYRG